MLTNAAAVASTSSLETIATLATFGAFKVDEKFSFVRPYNVASVQGIPNFRHAVIRYRVTGTEKVEKPAKMVTVPSVALPEEYELLDERAKKVILGLYEDEQDRMLRSMIDAGKDRIQWETVTLNCILDSLTAERMSSRLTKEQIENWARVALLKACEVRADQVSEAKSFNEEQKLKQRAGTLNAYVALACKLAAPVPNVGQSEATALKNMLIVSELDDDMAKVLLAKLDNMLNPKVIENAYL